MIVVLREMSVVEPDGIALWPDEPAGLRISATRSRIEVAIIRDEFALTREKLTVSRVRVGISRETVRVPDLG